MQEQSEYYKMLAKALISNADGICDAIDRYIAKADDDLKKTLDDEGYAEADDTVSAMNDMEEQIVEILQGQTEELVTVLEASEDSDWEDVEQKISEMLDNDDIEEQVQEVAQEMLTVEVPHLATVYMQESDGELVVDTLRQRTTSWISSWSQQLGTLMRISTHQQITDLIQNTIESGSDIASLTRKIMDGGWRSEYYQAKRVAVTEVLRAHSVAREEAIQQSPAVEQKEWRHTGAHKNQPRPNHVAMDHQIVPKDQPFEMQGRDGGTYYPMYPRDPILPASESVNCHCIHRGIVSEDVLGLSYDERKAMQEAAIASDNGSYAKELDAQNMAAAGITPYNALENFSQKTREKQIKYIGGKAKMALYDAGLIDSEEMLKKVKKSTLQELRDDGIFTVKQAAVNHSVTGTYKAASKSYPNGRMVSGGHTQAAMLECSSKGISYEVTGTFSNGVRVGNVPSSELKIKKTGNGQAWFPENWDEAKVMAAGTAVANNGQELVDGYRKTGVFDGVAVRVLYNDGEIATICPDLDQNLYVEGVEALDGGTVGKTE